MKKTLYLFIVFIFCVLLTSNSHAYESNENLLKTSYIIKYINKYRTLYSLKPLEENKALNTSSQNHAMYLKQNNSKSQIEDVTKKGFTGVYPWDRAASLGFTSSLITEEIFVTSESVDNIVMTMISNPTTRMNILNPSNEKIGVGNIGNIYVMDFAQGSMLYEKELNYPTENLCVIEKDTNVYDIFSIMFFSKEEITDVNLIDASLIDLKNDTKIDIKSEVLLLSNIKATLTMKPTQKLEKGKVYEASGEFIVKFLDGTSKTINNAWKFTYENIMENDNSYKEDELEILELSNHWAYKEIKEFLNKKYINLDEESTYKPNENITRGEIADIISKALELSDVDVEHDFKDVSKDNKVNDSIKKVYAYDIMLGIGNNEFGISNNLTREEMFVILSNIYEQIKGEITLKSSANNFKDFKECSTWAQEKIKRLLEIKLVSGKDDGLIHPKDNLTKAECIVLISRLINEIN